MLKWLGIGMVIVSSGAIGGAMSRDMEKRIRQLKEIRKMLVILDGEIRYANETLSQAFLHTAKRVGAPFSGFLEHMAEEMEAYSGEMLHEIFKRRIKEDLGHTALLERDLEQLKRFGEQLGYLDMQMQRNSIAFYTEQVNEACRQAQEEYKSKAKVYHCLGVTGGLFLAIIFL